MKVKSLSRVRLPATPWTAAYQAPLSVGFSRQEYWSGVPFSSPGNLPSPGTEPESPSLQADSLMYEPPIQGTDVTIFKIDKGNLSFQLFAQKLLAFCGLRASELKDSGFIRHIL